MIEKRRGGDDGKKIETPLSRSVLPDYLLLLLFGFLRRWFPFAFDEVFQFHFTNDEVGQFVPILAELFVSKAFRNCVVPVVRGRGFDFGEVAGDFPYRHFAIFVGGVVVFVVCVAASQVFVLGAGIFGALGFECFVFLAKAYHFVGDTPERTFAFVLPETARVRECSVFDLFGEIIELLGSFHIDCMSVVA